MEGKGCIFTLLVCICFAYAQGLTHPGVLLGKSQLDFIKQQVNNGVEPFKTAYTKALNSNIGSKTYKAEGPPASKVIECGSTSNPNHGCSADDNDSAAAYLQSVLWYITNDTTYVNNAIKLLDAYSSLQKFNNSNAPLQAGWSSSKWTRAAEIVRHTSTAWPAAAATAFQNTLNKVHLPLIKGGSSSNGNWELAMIEGMMGIAVFSDDTDLFNQAVTYWKQRVPAYFYYSESDGGKPVPAPRGNPSWYDQTTFNKSVDGICQETCRDLGHTQYGLASTLNAAATAAAQGTDLFGSQQARLVAAMEFNANFLAGASVPKYVCGGSVNIDQYPTFELGYNHYHNKEGVSMPDTLKQITEHVRTMSNLSDGHIAVWETLTNGGSP